MSPMFLINDRKRKVISTKSLGVLPTPLDMFSHALTINGNSGHDFTFVQRFEVAAFNLPLDNNIQQVRFTLQASTNGPWTINEAYVGHAAGSGDAYDFDTTPVTITFAGSGSVTIPTGGTVVTDWAAFAYNKTSALLFSLYLPISPDSSTKSESGVSNVNFYSKAGNSAATINKSGYTLSANTLIISKVETDVD